MAPDSPLRIRHCTLSIIHVGVYQARYWLQRLRQGLLYTLRHVSMMHSVSGVYNADSLALRLISLRLVVTFHTESCALLHIGIKTGPTAHGCNDDVQSDFSRVSACLQTFIKQRFDGAWPPYENSTMYSAAINSIARYDVHSLSVNSHLRSETFDITPIDHLRAL